MPAALVFVFRGLVFDGLKGGGIRDLGTHATKKNLMLRTMLTGKVHRATVTHANLHYVGSITTGARLETHTIAGERSSGVIGINGAAAHLIHVHDVIIVIAYDYLRRMKRPRSARRTCM